MKLPIMLGIENYLEAISKYYVDKTLLIRDILETAFGGSVIITRPRRFGKSLTLSMLEYFFTNEGDYRYAFADKKIAAEEQLCQTHMNQYPVIHLNMKDVYGSSLAEIKGSLADTLSMMIRHYTYLLDSDKLLDIEKSELRRYLEKTADDALLFSFVRRLSIALYKHFGKKVIVLVDEYDAPIARLGDACPHEDAVEMLRPLYSNGFKGNDCVALSVLTGVLHFSKESLFSGLNNPIDASLVDAFLHPYFGFTEEEVREIIAYYELPTNVDTLRRWYGGYNRLNGLELFNPWSIMNYALNRRLTPYWVNTGSNRLLKQIVATLDATRLLDVVGKEGASIYFIKEINYQNYAANRNTLLSFLVQSGYLTVSSYRESQCQFDFPNEEITTLFEHEILSNGQRLEEDYASEIRRGLLEADTATLTTCLRDYVLSCLSYYDTPDEKAYQNLVTGMLAMLFTDYVVKSEVNAGRGRCDILVTPKALHGVGMALEIKQSNAKKEPSRTNLEKIAQSALSQIKEKDYGEELSSRRCNKKIYYGFSFYQKNVAIAVDVEG